MASLTVGDITIVVPTRNRPTTTFQLLNYLRRELCWESPIVIVDQSDDHGAELNSLIADANFEGITCLYSHERGSSAGRNAGAKYVITDWIFFLDDDVRPNSYYLDTVVNFLNANLWVDVVQPEVRQHSEWIEYAQDPDTWHRRHSAESSERQQNPSAWDGVRWFQTRIPSSYATSAIGLGTAFVISRRAFFGVGGFDQTLIGLGDDRELAVRLWWYGYRIQQLPRAVGFHLRNPEGGTRARPENTSPGSPALIYLYLKWFPGYPTYCYIGFLLLQWIRRPDLFPLRLVHLVTEIRRSRDALKYGGHYIDNQSPLPRCLALAEQAPTRDGTGV